MTHTQKIDEAWELYTTTSGWITCYDIFTNAGKYRGGKIYDTDKKYVILSGKCELIREINEEDITNHVSAENGIFEIKSGTPHLFYFPEDTRLIEWFPEWTKSKNYERYRAMKK